MGENSPEDLQRPEISRELFSQLLVIESLWTIFEKSLRILIQEARHSQQYKDLADALPAILDLQVNENSLF
jgi:hypothetical protein